MAGGDMKMMNLRSTMKIYPRPDNYYTTKHSLDFDMMRSKIFLERPSMGNESVVLWIAHAACGFLIGVVGFMLTWVEDTLTAWRASTV